MDEPLDIDQQKLQHYHAAGCHNHHISTYFVMSDRWNILGQTLANARASHDMSISQAAELLGISKTQYMRMERGDNHFKDEYLMTLAVYLELNVDELREQQTMDDVLRSLDFDHRPQRAERMLRTIIRLIKTLKLSPRHPDDEKDKPPFSHRPVDYYQCQLSQKCLTANERHALVSDVSASLQAELRFMTERLSVLSQTTEWLHKSELRVAHKIDELTPKRTGTDVLPYEVRSQLRDLHEQYDRIIYLVDKTAEATDRATANLAAYRSLANGLSSPNHATDTKPTAANTTSVTEPATDNPIANDPP